MAFFIIIIYFIFGETSIIWKIRVALVKFGKVKAFTQCSQKIKLLCNLFCISHYPLWCRKPEHAIKSLKLLILSFYINLSYIYLDAKDGLDKAVT